MKKCVIDHLKHNRCTAKHLQDTLCRWHTSDYYITQTTSSEGIRRFPGLLEYVTARFIIQEIRSKEVKRYPWVLKYVSIIFETQDMFNEAVRMYRCALICVYDRFKMPEMYTKEVKRCPGLQVYVPHYYLTQEKCNKPVAWVGYDGYKESKVLKKQIKMSYYPLHEIDQYGEPGVYWRRKRKRKAVVPIKLQIMVGKSYK